MGIFPHVARFVSHFWETALTLDFLYVLLKPPHTCAFCSRGGGGGWGMPPQFYRGSDYGGSYGNQSVGPDWFGN